MLRQATFGQVEAGDGHRHVGEVDLDVAALPGELVQSTRDRPVVGRCQVGSALAGAALQHRGTPGPHRNGFLAGEDGDAVAARSIAGVVGQVVAAVHIWRQCVHWAAHLLQGQHIAPAGLAPDVESTTAGRSDAADVEGGGSEHTADPTDEPPGPRTGRSQFAGAARVPSPGTGPVTPSSDRKSTRLNSSHVATSYAVF